MRLVEVKNLEERRNVPIILCNESLQKANQQIRGDPSSVKLTSKCSDICEAHTCWSQCDGSATWKASEFKVQSEPW